MLLRDIAQSTRRREIANGSAGGMRKHIVGNRNQRVFLAEHLAIFLDECQAVDIGIDNDTHIIATLLQLIHNTTEVLL